MKYFLIVLMISLFVLSYVWQNIEVMKAKMSFREYLRAEREFVVKNDYLRYEIESFKKLSRINEYARENGYKRITPNDVVTLVVRDGNDKK